MKKHNSWFMFAVLYFCAMIVSISQYKIAPIMSTVAEAMNVSMTDVAWLTSVFTVSGIVLSIPSAAIMEKVGMKKLGVIILSLLTIGSFIGQLTNDFMVLMISRVIEGISLTFMLTMGLTLVNRWFPPEKVGLVTGIWTTFPAVASWATIGFGAQVSIALGSWKSLWVITTIGGLAATILYAAFIHVPKIDTANASGEKISLREGYKNIDAILLGIPYGAVAMVLLALSNTSITIFTGHYGLSLTEASTYISVGSVTGILAGFISGGIIAKSKKVPLLTAVSMVLLGVFCFQFYRLTTPATFIINSIGRAFLISFVIAAVLAIVPGTAKHPLFIGPAIAVMSTLYNIGCMIGPPLFTVGMEAGPSAATAVLLVVCAVGFLSVVVFMVRHRKSVK